MQNAPGVLKAPLLLGALLASPVASSPVACQMPSPFGVVSLGMTPKGTEPKPRDARRQVWRASQADDCPPVQAGRRKE
jgi:hypothetical protein